MYRREKKQFSSEKINYCKVNSDHPVSASEPEEEQELYEHHHFTVDKGQHPIRIDKFLSERINTSRNKIQSAAEAGSIQVNEKSVKSNYKLKPLDEISIILPYPKKEIKLIPENIPLNIVFEDDDLIIVNKNAGMVVHPGHGNYSGTLINALLFHFKPATANHQPPPPFLVHRIDKDTTGLLVIAKNEIAMIFLAKQFFKKSIERTYIALVWGDLKDDSGTITGNIGRSTKDRKIMQVFPDGEYGKPAVTHYKVLERFGYVTLVECKLETGRTHQIRAHFRHIGHPLFNDEKYGGNNILKGTVFTKYRQFVENCFAELPRQALHAKSLGFAHPSTKKKIFFDSKLPSDMQTVIDKWRNYAVHKIAG